MKTAWVLAIVISTSSVGCATTRVGIDRDPNVNLARYRTFLIQSGLVVNNGVLDERDPNQRIRVAAAIMYQLQLKGLIETADRPDLIVTYTADDLTSPEYGTRVTSRSGFSPHADEAPWSTIYRESRIIIHVYDAQTKQLVWRAIARANNKDIRSPDFIARAVDEALAEYPKLAQAW